MGGLQSILELKNRVENLPAILVGELRTLFEASETAILQMQCGQLMEGKDSSGKDIRPYYSEDPYFHSKETAKAYAAWKKRITPNPRRRDDAPNLYINGRFHSELGVYYKPDGFKIDGVSWYAMGIVHKYGLDTFGLNEANRNEIIRPYVPQIMEHMKKYLYGNG